MKSAGREPRKPAMALKESEAIVLRTYPLREADLLVTLFTRNEGRVKGVARSAKKSKKRFGGALEPMTYVRSFYDDRERRELARRLERGDVATAFGGRIEGLHRYTSEWIAFDDGRAIDICIDALRRVAG